MIVDDHPLVREGLAMRISLEPDMCICAEAGSESEALTTIGSATPDLVIVDISLKDGDGLSLLKRISSRFPHIKTLVFSGFDDSLYAERSLRAGALGYLNKQEPKEKLLSAIRAVLKGHRFVSEAVSQRLMARGLNGGESAQSSPEELLSNRELEVLRMIGQGHATSDIAFKLHLSTHTIDSHRENIKRKLGLKTAGELNRTAVEWVLQQGSS